METNARTKTANLLARSPKRPIIRHSEGPESRDVRLGGLTIGDVAFAVAPYEMFDTNGMEIKDGSPFSTTFVLTCANDNLNYLPSELAWQHGGYAIDATLFQRGTAEELVENYLTMLNTLYQMP